MIPFVHDLVYFLHYYVLLRVSRTVTGTIILRSIHPVNTQTSTHAYRLFSAEYRHRSELAGNISVVPPARRSVILILFTNRFLLFIDSASQSNSTLHLRQARRDHARSAPRSRPIVLYVFSFTFLFSTLCYAFTTTHHHKTPQLPGTTLRAVFGSARLCNKVPVSALRLNRRKARDPRISP